MSAQVQSQSIRVSPTGTILVAVVAFAIGVLGTFAVAQYVERSNVVDATASSTLWDTGRLEAMEGRVAAATISTTPVVWDSWMTEAMEGRQLAETLTSTRPVIWDRSKLEAMQGRQLAAIEPVVWDSFMSEPARSLIGELSHSQL
jgi:hypothetical protein